jgi:Transglycosylase
VLLVLLASGVAVEIHALGLDRLPDVHAVMTNPLPTDTMVYDRTGAVLIADLHPGGHQHYRTPLQDMGRWLPAATDAETGSAMAQRLVRLRLGVGGPGTAAKIRQAALAAQLSVTYSHSQILEAYLQSLFYGNGAYGPQAAAQIYFGIDASKLDLAQAALLAGLTDEPTQLDPFRNLSARSRGSTGCWTPWCETGRSPLRRLPSRTLRRFS